MKQPCPKLEYCYENVRHIYSDYRKMISHGREQDAKLQIKSLVEEGYIFLEHKKKQLTPKIVQDKWNAIKPDTFSMLVSLLYDKGFLTLWDNHHLYENEQALFHALNAFYKTPPNMDFKRLAGEYRTFIVTLVDYTRIVKGHLSVKYHQDGNFLTVYHNLSSIEDPSYQYQGIITYLKDYNNLIMHVTNGNDIMQTTHFQPYQINNNHVLFEGLNSAFCTTRQTHHMRRVFLDKLIEQEPFIDKKTATFDIEEHVAPEHYAEHLNYKSGNFAKLDMIKQRIDLTRF